MTYVDTRPSPGEPAARPAAPRRPVRIVSPTASGRRWRLARRGEGSLWQSASGPACTARRHGARSLPSDRAGAAEHERAPR